jgi:hypothetical protein
MGKVVQCDTCGIIGNPNGIVDWIEIDWLDDNVIFENESTFPVTFCCIPCVKSYIDAVYKKQKGK